MNREELLSLINQESTDNIFDPYNCCKLASEALVNFLSDDLLPDQYYVEYREPIFVWGTLKIRFTTRNSFKYQIGDETEWTKGHYFGISLDEKYINDIKQQQLKKIEATRRVDKYFFSLNKKENKTKQLVVPPKNNY